MSIKFTGLLFFFVFLTGLSAMAQDLPVEEYFHRSANAYINADLNHAMETVLQGLAQYPDNTKLSELKRLIEEEQQRQQEQQQQQQESDDENAQEEEVSEQPDEQEMQPEEEEYQPEEISLEEAEKILQALAQKEKELLKEFKKPRTTTTEKHEKDW